MILGNYTYKIFKNHRSKKRKENKKERFRNPLMCTSKVEVRKTGELGDIKNGKQEASAQSNLKIQ